MLGLGWDAATLYRLHPDEYLFFNPLVGGLAGASRNYDTDYWVNTMPEAVIDLEHYLDRTEGKDAAGQSLSGRSLQRASAIRESGRFASRVDARRGSCGFLIAPTHMDCDREFKGRVVATVERLGVLISVVKDRRAITHPNLAGIPPPIDVWSEP